ncbi:hypothetical protein BMS3Bbin12_00067 [bacterium BMS3Bbin12]|nr:hypothetical protein BMS3Bbin12_00067 [bacterium BMS3Bbin12]GBE50617.1 hypothetical protein BMS3Bbin13_01557 [bacterium BMS3Bbin13]
MSTVRSRTLLNLALIVVAAALGLVVYLRPGHRPPPPKPPITPLHVKDIARIRIVRPGHETIELQRNHGVWRITAPIRARADTMRVEGIEAAAGARSLARYPVARLKLGGVGLAPPKVRLRLNGRELDFGGTDPINQWRYVKVGDTVHLTTDTVYPFLTMPPTAFVNLALLPPGAQITSLALPKLTLHRGANEHWSITPPHPGIDRARIRSLLRRWRDVRALFVQRDHGGASKGRITIRLKGRKSPLRFVIRRTHPGLVLARPDAGLSYHLGSSGSRGLLALPPSKTPAAKPPKPPTRSPPDPRDKAAGRAP